MLFQITKHFGFSKYITFTMYLDKQYIHKKPKDHIILNGRSIMLYKQPTAEMIYRSNPRP
jgi:hypothetical protein